MSNIIMCGGRDLGEVLEDLLALAKSTREKYRPQLAAALASDDPDKLDAAMSCMNEDANDLVKALGAMEGIEAEVDFTFEADVDVDDNFQISILLHRGYLIEAVPHA